MESYNFEKDIKEAKQMADVLHSYLRREIDRLRYQAIQEWRVDGRS